MHSIQTANIEVEGLRTRLRKVVAELRQGSEVHDLTDGEYGQTAAASVCAAITRSARRVAQEASTNFAS
jgi:hypothetical protein